MTKDRTTFLLEQAEAELRDGLYFEVKGDDLRIVVEALKRACPSERLPDPVATLRLLAKCGSMDLSALGPIADELERLIGEAEVANEQLAQLRGFAEAHKTCVGMDEIEALEEMLRRANSALVRHGVGGDLETIQTQQAEIERLQKDRNECLEAFHILFRIFPEPK